MNTNGEWDRARIASTVLGVALALVGCGDSEGDLGGEGGKGGDGKGGDVSDGGNGGDVSDGGNGGAITNGGNGGTGAGGDTGGTGGGGTPDPGCTETAEGPTRGDAIAVSPDDSRIVVANRDVGTVTVFSVDYTDALLPALTKEAELPVGNEPWQVVIDACGDKAYVVVRRDQKVVVIEDLKTTPVVGAEVAVGSEPTSLALSPNGTALYVANWVDGTVTVLGPEDETFGVTGTIDLNPVLAATGLLGASVSAASSRGALAHPRSIAITNDGDSDDNDEQVLVTEFFAQRTEAEESPSAVNADLNWVGGLYSIDTSNQAASFISLAPWSGPVVDTGCFPNQLQSVTVRGDSAYVTSICASPKGPTNPKTNTHPVVSVVDLTTGDERSGSPVNLNAKLDAFYTANGPAAADSPARRHPLVANSIAFDPVTGAAYITANGADAVFRAVFDATSGDVTEVGSGATKPYFDLAPPAFAEADRGQNPNGIAAANNHSFAFVINDVTRNVTTLAIDPAVQEIAGNTANDPCVALSSPLPTVAADQAALRGRRAFNTGLDRWSQDGQAWGACQACHFEGLSDNITWYFGRGPRQSTSLEGSFASNDPANQRIFNWTGVFDEIADFEGVARNIDGGVGAIVHTLSATPVSGDRIDLASVVSFPDFGAAGLNGSALILMQQLSLLQTWADVEVFAQRVRSPRKPTNLDPVKVAAGLALFSGAGGCAGCHGDAKWTNSKRFYTPGSATNDALKTTAWNGDALITAGFPGELFPATLAVNQRMRFTAAGGDRIQCVLRNVGTYGQSPTDVNVLELQQNMTAAGQGALEGGNGFNVPSLLGMQTGAPYFHAGNARTLEELLDDVFTTHREALADAGFLSGASEAADREALVAFLLSIDESTAVIPGPLTPGADGGVFCAAP